MRNWRKLTWFTGVLIAWLLFLMLSGQYLELIALVVFVLALDPIIKMFPRKPKPEPGPENFDWLPFKVQTLSWCKVHKAVASRQQVKGGQYEWMPYCNWRTRAECEMTLKVYRDQGAP